ncbi:MULTISPECIES: potassium channel family protein [Mycolicibacter]|uniref:Trk system potassium uptake protein TrkA n=1 Tax=Mycolicibacter virginiensis TaxID=1795032 RepID=A0A9X7IRN4_9MYCO|nr:MULTISPECIES: TrkA family potassium uptake protein [Mycobacteriaceae]OBG37426.1 potassium transporter TrkA [Mycolicibacter heraklionensis]OBJ34488.1 potassium transporter TrkA [Mycolicibacter heraklionensis]PQM54139.1 TrkA family potassium uptake protein [Mycolicibacter virginiensis]ULP47959.1 TrkA family potassium uptake protein [Mycolicibacter virginiensis]
MRIGIAGAGAVGRSVARELIGDGHRVLLIERNPAHYQPHTVPEAEWLLADACELSALRECGIEICDVVIAATGDDKANLATALLAKAEFGVARVVARVNNARNEPLFTEEWGIDVAVSTPRAMVAAVEGAIDVGHLVPLMGLRRGQASLTKLTLPDDNPLIGRQVCDIVLPEGAALVAVQRGDRVILPRATEALQAGDEMLFAAASGIDDEVRAVVHGAPASRRAY